MLNNKVILQIVPALNNGGVERGVIETSKFLVKNNNKSIVISSGGVYEHLISRHGGILYKLDVHLKNPLKWKKLRIKVELASLCLRSSPLGCPIMPVLQSHYGFYPGI